VSELEGETALITGASSGLGFHFAKVLARAGAHVILCARREDALLKRADAIRSAGGQVSTSVLDVTDPDSITAP